MTNQRPVLPASVLQVVARVVDVDAVVLVGQVSLYLVPRVPVDPQLVVDLLQRPLHLVLAALDVVHLPHQTVLHTVIDQIYSLPPLPSQNSDEGQRVRIS